MYDTKSYVNQVGRTRPNYFLPKKYTYEPTPIWTRQVYEAILIAILLSKNPTWYKSGGEYEAILQYLVPK